jgi:Flp pilus assembly protein TadG
MKSTIATPIRIPRATHGRCMKSASADFMKIKDQRGGSMVEFAIIAPLLFVIVFGIIEFGILLFDKAMLTNATREGARYGIVFFPGRISDTEIRKVVKDYCANYLISFGSSSVLEDTDIIIDPPGDRTNLPAGTSLRVAVNYQFQFLVFSNVLALIGGNMGNLINLSAETVMRLE